MELSLSLSSLLLIATLELDSEYNLLFRIFSKKALFASISDISDSWLLLALEALLPHSLKMIKAAQKSEDKLSLNTLIRELSLTALPIKKYL